MINESDFRDQMIAGLTIKYEWDGSPNHAVISVINNDKVESNFKITGLTEYNIYDDFGTAYISNCKVLISKSSVYISLDPYDESNKAIDLDKDCMWFLGKAVIEL